MATAPVVVSSCYQRPLRTRHDYVTLVSLYSPGQGLLSARILDPATFGVENKGGRNGHAAVANGGCHQR